MPSDNIQIDWNQLRSIYNTKKLLTYHYPISKKISQWATQIKIAQRDTFQLAQWYEWSITGQCIEGDVDNVFGGKRGLIWDCFWSGYSNATKLLM